MFGLIFVLLIVVPIVELWVLFQVADGLGWGISILTLLAISFLGAALMKWQTTGAFARVTDKMRQGQMPSTELVDGALMIFGGALLLTPGFFTDAVGLAMFIPPLRAIARRIVLRRMNTRVTTFAAGAGSPFSATFTSSTTFGGPFGPTGTRNRSDAIDVDEVHVERVDTEPSQLPPLGPPE